MNKLLATGGIIGGIALVLYALTRQQIRALESSTVSLSDTHIRHVNYDLIVIDLVFRVYNRSDIPFTVTGKDLSAVLGNQVISRVADQDVVEIPPKTPILITVPIQLNPIHLTASAIGGAVKSGDELQVGITGYINIASVGLDSTQVPINESIALTQLFTA